LKDLGSPGGEGESIGVFDGPYGLYVKQGKVNASLPEGSTADTITIEEAVALLAAKAATGKAKAKARKPATAKKAADAKPTTTKAAATKTDKAGAKPAKLPASKTGRPRASAVRIIKAASS